MRDEPQDTAAREVFLGLLGVNALLEILGVQRPLWVAVPLAFVWVVAGGIWAAQHVTRWGSGAVPRHERRDTVLGWSGVAAIFALLPLGAVLGLWK